MFTQGASPAVTAILVWWAIIAAAILGLMVVIGLAVNRRPFGILIDTRGRYSLTQLQVSMWTVVVLSLIAGTFAGRWQHHVPNPLHFTIPSQLLGVLGISLGSGVVATVVKSTKDATNTLNVAASEPSKLALKTLEPSWQPRFAQVFMEEEGTYADEVVDISKFQNFIITLVLVTAYVGTVISALHGIKNARDFSTLPTFDTTFLTLLGISHGAYVAGKIPPQKGTPRTSLAVRRAIREAERQTVAPPLVPGPPPAGLAQPLPTAQPPSAAQPPTAAGAARSRIPRRIVARRNPPS
ncbi:MAG: hypothetical protein ACJ74U_19680 [Jatrophihabitantaceae bacterium]